MTEQIKYCCFTVNMKYIFKLGFEEDSEPAGSENEMGGECGTYGTEENFIRCFGRKP
jgi:hypothetical protein